MAKGFLKGLWDKVSGEEQARQEAEAQERRRLEAERIAQEEQRARQQRIEAQRLNDFKNELNNKLSAIEKKLKLDITIRPTNIRPYGHWEIEL